MKNKFDIPQLFLRLALGLGFLLPVLDRLGWFGEPGTAGVGWGNWATFVDYTNSLMPYLNRSMTNAVATFATTAEIVFGITLIVGYRTTIAAWGSFVLTLLFAISMFFFEGPRSPFNYSVFADSAASFLLATIPTYKWSVENFLFMK
jgi:uncharacterized membrane protein YphA (DoxX/SURF4 family)